MTKDYVKAAVWGMISGLAIVTLLIASGNGCSAFSTGAGAESPERSTARAAVLMVAKAVVVADQSCASFALQVKDAKIAKACADAYDVARPVLLAGEASLDTWDATAQGKIGCAINSGVTALTDVSVILVQQHLAIPSVVLDALKLVNSVKFTCSSVVIVDAGGDGQ